MTPGEVPRVGAARQEWRYFLVALQFLTRIHVPALPGFEPVWLDRSAAYFPAVGLLVGVMSALVLLAASLAWSAPICAVLAVAVGIALTGAFHEVLFPTAIALGSHGGPERRTDIVVLGSGAEERNSRWSASRRRYNAGYGVTSLDELHTVLAFFEDLSRLLPDNTWVQQFDLKTVGKGREVQVSGETTSSSKLIEILEGSTLLQNAAPRGTEVRGSQPNTVRFMIAADVRARAQPETRPILAAVPIAAAPAAAPASQPAAATQPTPDAKAPAAAHALSPVTEFRRPGNSRCTDCEPPIIRVRTPRDSGIAGRSDRNQERFFLHACNILRCFPLG